MPACELGDRLTYLMLRPPSLCCLRQEGDFYGLSVDKTICVSIQKFEEPWLQRFITVLITAVIGLSQTSLDIILFSERLSGELAGHFAAISLVANQAWHASSRLVR